MLIRFRSVLSQLNNFLFWGAFNIPTTLKWSSAFLFKRHTCVWRVAFSRCNHFWLKLSVKILLFCMLQQDLYLVLIRPLNILPVDIQAIPFLILQLRSMIEGAMLKILQVSCLLLSLSRFTSSSLNVLVLLSYLLYSAIEFFYFSISFLLLHCYYLHYFCLRLLNLVTNRIRPQNKCQA